MCSNSKCSAILCPLPQCGQIGDSIWPISAWYEAVKLHLLSLTWWIALCACLETPGCIPVLGWPRQHFKYQLAVPLGLLALYFQIPCTISAKWTVAVAEMLNSCQHLPLFWLVDLFCLICPLISLNSCMSWHPDISYKQHSPCQLHWLHRIRFWLFLLSLQLSLIFLSLKTDLALPAWLGSPLTGLSW